MTEEVWQQFQPCVIVTINGYFFGVTWYINNCMKFDVWNPMSENLSSMNEGIARIIKDLHSKLYGADYSMSQVNTSNTFSWFVIIVIIRLLFRWPTHSMALLYT